MTYETTNIDINTLEPFVAKQSEAERVAFESALARYRELDTTLTEARRAMYEELKPHELAIQEIHKQYDPKIASLDGQEKACNLYELKHSYERSIARARAELAIQANGRFTVESFKNLLESIGIRVYRLEEMPALPNGVQLFRHYETWSTGTALKVSDADGVAYFAVKGKDIIGFQVSKKSKHPGDQAEYDAWLNKIDLTPNEQMVYIQEFKYGWDKLTDPYREVLQVARFKVWKDAVAKLTEFIPIDLNNPKNVKVMDRTEAYGYAMDVVARQRIENDPTIPRIREEKARK
jgi:hypothetical protein